MDSFIDEDAARSLAISLNILPALAAPFDLVGGAGPAVDMLPVWRDPNPPRPLLPAAPAMPPSARRPRKGKGRAAKPKLPRAGKGAVGGSTAMLETNIKLANCDLATVPERVFASAAQLHFLNLCRNGIVTIPSEIGTLAHLVELNLGRNRLTELPRELTDLVSLVRLDLSSNRLRKLPAGFARLKMLQQLQLNGNELGTVPEAIFTLPMMLKLYVGSNGITNLDKRVGNLKNLEVLYLGGNELTEVPVELGTLHNLSLLYLGDNKLEQLPAEIGRLGSLRTLNLHNNKFKYLPQEIMRMNNLENLSLRGNPLIVDFVNTPIYEPLTLKELAGRAVKNLGIRIDKRVVPEELCHFLDGAQRCNNPSCAGVYFQSSVKNLQVVDFCGKFRVPLLKFLCEEKCTDDDTPSRPLCEKATPRAGNKPCLKKMKRVLMDGWSYECDCIACSN